MRYISALVVAALLIGGGLFYAQWTITEFEAAMRDRIQEMKRAGKLPPDADISNVGVQLPRADMRRLQISRLLLDFWFVWGPVVLVLCLGAAAVMKRSGVTGS